MKKPGASIYLRRDGRWEARYRKGNKEDGTLQYCSVYGATYQEADKKRAEILTELSRAEFTPAEQEDSAIPSVHADIQSIYRTKRSSRDAQAKEPLSEATAALLCHAIEQCELSTKLGLMLSLYMGLAWGEVCALQYTDFTEDLQSFPVTKVMFDSKNMPGVITSCPRRNVPIPKIIKKQFMLQELVESGGSNYILTSSDEPVKSALKAINACTRELAGNGFSQKIYPDSLRATFIRRAFEAGINLETVSELVGIEENILLKRYGIYIHPVPELIDSIVKEMPASVEAETKKQNRRQMNLLILGAGSQGPVVKEIAEALGIFNRIDYLDDNPDNTLSIDSCENYLKYIDTYPVAIPSFGDCQLRANWSERLSEAGFILPKLIHPSATVMGNVEIGDGTVVEAKTILSSGAKVGKNCIISAGAVLDKECVIGSNTHIGCACTVSKGSAVPEFSRLSAGTIFTSQQ